MQCNAELSVLYGIKEKMEVFSDLRIAFHTLVITVLLKEPLPSRIENVYRKKQSLFGHYIF